MGKHLQTPLPIQVQVVKKINFQPPILAVGMSNAMAVHPHLNSGHVMSNRSSPPSNSSSSLGSGSD